MLAMNVIPDCRRRRTSACALTFALLLTLCAPLAAEPVPGWSRAKFDYVAQRQDLRQVLRDFARAMRVQLDLADDVAGSVTGRFDMAPPVLLDMLGSFHQFVWHYDGAVLYIGSSKPGAQKMRLRARPADDVASAAASNAAATATATAAAPATATATATAAVAAAAPSSAPAAAAAPLPKPLPSWTVKLEDGTLSKTFGRWAAEAGWQLLWELPVDFRIDANTRVEGDFEQAVTAVADSLAGAETPMQVVLYRGNHVIRVTSKGNP